MTKHDGLTTQQRYYAKNKEKIALQQKNYRESHKERIKEQVYNWLKNNREHYKEYQKKYRKENDLSRKDYQKRYIKLGDKYILRNKIKELLDENEEENDMQNTRKVYTKDIMYKILELLK